MPKIDLELDPVTHITVDALGKPGQRVFYLQAWKANQVVTLLIEKAQVVNLSVGVEQFFKEIHAKFPDLPASKAGYDESKMHIQPPVDPLFRVGELGLAFEQERDMVCLVAREITLETTDPEQAGVVRFWCTRPQLLALVTWGLELSGRGRPICPQCGQPMEPEGHFCPKKNGHKH